MSETSACRTCIMDWWLNCPLIQSQLRSTESTINNAYRKTFFFIKSYDIESDRVIYFNCSFLNSRYKRKTNFLAKLKCSETVLNGLFSNVVSIELSSMQLNVLDLS